jgi:hypothetical protein
MLIAHLPVTPCVSHRERCRRRANRANQARIHSPYVRDGTLAGISTPSLASHDVEYDRTAGTSGRMSWQDHSLVAHPRPVRRLLAISGRSWLLRASHLQSQGPCGCRHVLDSWVSSSLRAHWPLRWLILSRIDGEGRGGPRGGQGRAAPVILEPDGPSWTRVDVQSISRKRYKSHE